MKLWAVMSYHEINGNQMFGIFASEEEADAQVDRLEKLKNDFSSFGYEEVIIGDTTNIDSYVRDP